MKLTEMTPNQFFGWLGIVFAIAIATGIVIGALYGIAYPAESVEGWEVPRGKKLVEFFLQAQARDPFKAQQDHAKAQKQFNDAYERLQGECEACQAKCAGSVQCVTDCVDKFIKARDQAGKQMRQQQGR